MRKLPNAICADCRKRITRHDAKRVIRDAPTHNPMGRYEILHTTCNEKVIKLED